LGIGNAMGTRVPGRSFFENHTPAWSKDRRVSNPKMEEWFSSKTSFVYTISGIIRSVILFFENKQEWNE
jgi:hypothetical protein